jgi:hypothetical protein
MARYRDAIEWVAANEETHIETAEEIVDDVCVMLVGDVFKKNYWTVAEDVMKRRRWIFRKNYVPSDD